MSETATELEFMRASMVKFDRKAHVKGFVDVITPSRIAGWVCDLSAPLQRLVVAIEIDGIAAAQVVADLYRPDVKAAGTGDGFCGFELNLKGAVLDSPRQVRCITLNTNHMIPFTRDVEVNTNRGNVREEPVRLLIWDLDETFWKGTLTEGGFTFSMSNRDIVVELSKRGIINTICSKNDYGAVKDVLVANDVWSYFVFPSINWEPKGPRIRSLIDAVQLRPSTVMFIDDNPSNLEEAKQFAPGLQTRSHETVGDLLTDPLFRGKDDSSLTRLAQYKALEQRKADEFAAGVDVADFLRASEIRVELEFDLSAHADRVIELINRTNQLNFTKNRLPESTTEAKRQLSDLLSSSFIQGALVRVVDRYGDHGYCGIYIHHSEERRLVHYCFSCRILGMGVERWLYNKLGRPSISITGEVLSDLFESTKIDWVNRHVDDPCARNERNLSQLADRVLARGACDLGAIIHYFGATFPKATGEYHVFRHGTAYRIDHTVFLRQTIEGVSADAMAAARKLGYTDSDFKTRLFDQKPGRQVIILGLTTDAHFGLYRHRLTGLTVPLQIPGVLPWGDGTRLDMSKLAAELREPWWKSALEFLRDEFDFVGRISETDFKSNVELALSKISKHSLVFVLQVLDRPVMINGRNVPLGDNFIELNRWIEDICQIKKNVTILRQGDYLEPNEKVTDHLHLSRMTYYRIYSDIVERLSKNDLNR